MGSIFQVNESNGNTTITGSLTMSSQQIHSVGDPTSAQDAATKNYVDGLANGISWKNAVLAATTTGLSTTFPGGYTATTTTLTENTPGNGSITPLDGVTLVVGSRVLVKNETGGNAKNNGIYTVTVLGDGSSVAWVLTRSNDMTTWAEVPAAAAIVEEGTVNADLAYVCTSDPGGTLGTTAITFVLFSTITGGVTSITGTANQIIASSSTGNITLSTPQSIGITSSPTFASLTLTNPLTVANGGTGQSTANAAYNALSPMTTKGDIEYEDATPKAVRLTIGSTGNVLTVSGGVPVWATPSGFGTVNSGTAGQFAYYATSTNAVSSLAALSYDGTDVLTYNSGASTSFMEIVGTANAIIDLISNGGTNRLRTESDGSLHIQDFSNSRDILLYAPSGSGLLTAGVPLAMGSNKITGLASATASGDALSFGGILTGSSLAFNAGTYGTIATFYTGVTVPLLAVGVGNSIYMGLNAGPATQPNIAAVVDSVAFGGGAFSSAEHVSSINDSAYCVAVGVNALASNTTGFENVAIGFESQLSTTTGVSNVSVGANTLQSNTTGDDNTACGHSALTANTTGNFNTSVGYGSLQGADVYSYNTAVGYNALNSMLDARNTCVGALSMPAATVGDNTSLGYAAGNLLTTGAKNIFIGSASGTNLPSVSTSIAIGYNAQVGANNSVALGYNATTTVANTCQLGDTATPITLIPSGGIQGQTGGTTPSAGNVGEVIQSIVLASGSTTSLLNNAWATVTSIVLTAGNWLITWQAGFNPNGAVFSVNTAMDVFIDTSGGTSGPVSYGDNAVELPIGSSGSNYYYGTVSDYHVVPSSTTTYYAKVGGAGITSGTPKAFGRITAVRIS